MYKCCTVTIDNNALGPFQIGGLLRGTVTAGVTVSQTYPNAGKTAAYLSIQSDPGNAGLTVYKGDSQLAVDGSHQGRTMQPGDIDIPTRSPSNNVSLEDKFITGTNTAKVNIEVDFI